MRSLSVYFTWSYWKLQWQLLTDPSTWYLSAYIKVLAVLAIAIVVYQLQNWWLRRRRGKSDAKGGRARKPALQRWLGRALSLVAPRWGRWCTAWWPAPGRARLPRWPAADGWQAPVPGRRMALASWDLGLIARNPL